MTFLTRYIYIRFDAQRLRIDTPGVSPGYDDLGVVAVRSEMGQKKVAAVGRGAEKLRSDPSVHLFYPFAHERIVFDDFHVASKLVQHALREIYRGMHWSQIRPMVRAVIHPLRRFEDGLTQAEEQLLVALAGFCGARSVCIHTGRELTISELESFGANNRFQGTSLPPFGRQGRP